MRRLALTPVSGLETTGCACCDSGFAADDNDSGCRDNRGACWRGRMPLSRRRRVFGADRQSSARQRRVVLARTIFVLVTTSAGTHKDDFRSRDNVNWYSRERFSFMRQRVLVLTRTIFVRATIRAHVRTNPSQSGSHSGLRCKSALPFTRGVSRDGSGFQTTRLSGEAGLTPMTAGQAARSSACPPACRAQGQRFLTDRRRGPVFRGLA